MSFARNMRRNALKKKNRGFPMGAPLSMPSGFEPLGGGRPAPASSNEQQWLLQVWMQIWMSTLGPRARELQRMLQTQALTFPDAITFEEGQIASRVHHGRKQVFTIVLKMPPWSSAHKRQALAAIAADSQARADIAEQKVSKHVDTVLRAADISLFARKPSEFKAQCSCTSKSSLCIHALAFVFILADMLDQQPSHLLSVRGLPIEVLALGVRQTIATAQPSPSTLKWLRKNADDDAALSACAPLPAINCDMDVFNGPTSIASLGHFDGWKMRQQPEDLWRPSVLRAARHAKAQRNVVESAR